MKLKFKHQPYQAQAVQAVLDCFSGQPKHSGLNYRIDPGISPTGMARLPDLETSGFKNAALQLSESQLRENIRAVQLRERLEPSPALVSTPVARLNLDIEMETGTGKTYVYIKTMFELYQRYGWSKFIVVVPSIAIREGIYKSLQITAEHFHETYQQQARFFIYNSQQLHHLESFSSDAGLNIMVINTQAFNVRKKNASAASRRIYDELDDFQSRRPIDVLRANNPILILDEPQKMEGPGTLESLKEFNPLFVLRYSATHKTQHNLIHRLDALDAYQQKLVKKIAVRGISIKGQEGSHAYLYLESIEISASKPPVARVEMEIKQKNGIKRVLRKLQHKDNLFELSGELEQYRGFVVAEIDARKDQLAFSNGVELDVGQVSGDVGETLLRRIQIRETIRAHFEKEQILFFQGVKVLSLFFIDEVAKYRCYEGQHEIPGEYAQIFEEEYQMQLAEQLTQTSSAYTDYLKGISVRATHNGYFSIDKKTRHLIDPSTGKKSNETDDVDAYDLILKDKERLLSLAEPVRFLFSHSALREGWDNPNVFVICTLKHSENELLRRQEVGRGLRLAVDQQGDRIDNPATVHQLNVLTVVANKSYRDFVSDLQKEILTSLSARPRKADAAYFVGKILNTSTGPITMTPQMAQQLYRYLIKQDYTDEQDQISALYHAAKERGELAVLPPELQPHAQVIFELIDGVFSESQLPQIEDERRSKRNTPNANLEKQAFQALWHKIHRKAIYTVQFDPQELRQRSVKALDLELKVSPLKYTIQRGEQSEEFSSEALKKGTGFQLKESKEEWNKGLVYSPVRYDLLGKLSESTHLTRATLARILQAIQPETFANYKLNPEAFIAQAARLINEQKATVIVDHIVYDPLEDCYEVDIFTQDNPKKDFSKAIRAEKHIYDYVFYDSQNERRFVEELDTSLDIEVFAKLPKSFFIPTPVGNYNPDWAIVFKSESYKHCYFIAETKGSLSSLELRKIEASKIDCARKFFAKISKEEVKYEVVDSFSQLMNLVK